MPLAPKRGGPSRGGGSNTRFTGRRGGPSRGRSGRGGGSGGVAYGIDRPAPAREDDGTAAAEKFEEVKAWDDIDEKLGFYRFESSRASGEEKVGWLVNMHQVSSFRPQRSDVLDRELTLPDITAIEHKCWRTGCCRFLLHPGRWRVVQGDDTIRAVLLPDMPSQSN